MYASFLNGGSFEVPGRQSSTPSSHSLFLLQKPLPTIHNKLLCFVWGIIYIRQGRNLLMLYNQPPLS